MATVGVKVNSNAYSSYLQTVLLAYNYIGLAIHILVEHWTRYDERSEDNVLLFTAFDS